MRRMFSSKAMNYKNGEVVINKAMVVEDNGDVTIGKDLAVDGKIIVNSANDVVDIHGQPIAGGSEFYVHDGYVEAESGTYYNFRVLSRVSTAYADFDALNNDNAKLFQISTVPADQMAGCSVEIDKSGNEYYTVTTVDGEYHEFETIAHFTDEIL